MIVALDVGGTSMKGAVLSPGLDRVTALRRPTPQGDAAVGAVVETVVELVERAGTARAVGLAVPGIVDDERGVAVWSENIGWRDAPFRDLIAERTGLPVAVGHDVRAGGTAEIRLGAARGARNSLVMPIGTGIAAAMVIDGHLCVGNGYAGEIGHMSVGVDEPCVCGGTGCLEAVASAAAVARRFARRTGREATADAVAALVTEGDADAAAIWAETIGFLGTALAAATALVAPEVIVIGGGLSRAGDLLLGPLSDDLAGRLTFHRRPRLTIARFGDEAGCVGAGLWARDLLERR
ncbi:ROK family protein [Actinoallomurus purpureus]|uniref:ROK family protein n=1 Tax=Actinoallomurus purpureus TaxID=478114 RepID=UPI002093083B|nr:ROK family protein [Actinoallomurus purpureus]MCO6007059.1 ROK family protein [Actinoallomurus purpureus]